MASEGRHRASELETQLAEAIGDPSVSQLEIMRMISQIPTDETFVMHETWLDLALNDSLEEWRRVEAYRALIQYGLSYPCAFSSFIEAVVTPLGLGEDELTNMSKAQHLPIERKSGDWILMAGLPFSTAEEPARLFFVVNRAEDVVERAAVYPAATSVDG